MQGEYSVRAFRDIRLFPSLLASFCNSLAAFHGQVNELRRTKKLDT